MFKKENLCESEWTFHTICQVKQCRTWILAGLAMASDCIDTLCTVIKIEDISEFFSSFPSPLYLYSFYALWKNLLISLIKVCAETYINTAYKKRMMRSDPCCASLFILGWD